jgi:hypothetical protein
MSWIDENGIAVDSPREDVAPEKIHEIRATTLFWHYMLLAGASYRDVAACFGVDHALVMRYVKSIPDDIKDEYESDAFVGRLRAAFPKGRRPKSPADVRAVLQALHAGRMQGRPPLPSLQEG